MQAPRALFRWVFPRGEFWNRLGIGLAFFLGLLFVVFVGAFCLVIPYLTANTVINDTSFEAYCRTSYGKPERLQIAPGRAAYRVDTYDCAVYEVNGGPYQGWLTHSTQDEPVLVSEFSPDIPKQDCDIGFELPR